MPVAMGDESVTSLVLNGVDAKPRQDQDFLSAEDSDWADSCFIKDPEISETNLDSLKFTLLDILSQHSELLPPSANGRGGLSDKTDAQILPAEDLNWADSCFIKDPEISETDLNSMKFAILDVLSQHSQTLRHSANERGGLNDTTDMEILPLVIDEDDTRTADCSTDELPRKEDPDVSFTWTSALLSTFKDEMINIQYSDSDDDFVLPNSVMEQPSEDKDIFKVWDLDFPVEEDELIKQLNEALSESSSNTTIPVPRKLKGLKTESLDNLAESIADLSLE